MKLTFWSNTCIVLHNYGLSNENVLGNDVKMMSLPCVATTLLATAWIIYATTKLWVHSLGVQCAHNVFGKPFSYYGAIVTRSPCRCRDRKTDKETERIALYYNEADAQAVGI